MQRQILDWMTGAVIWSGEAETVKDAIHAAVKAKANLSRANLSWANLSGAHLSGAHLSWANLSGAHLSGAHLSRADLSGAHLSGAHLSRADLSGANLSGANLSWADLSWAHLSGANLSWANLSGAHLSGAHLSGADLSWANLSGAHLSGAHLSGANQLVPPMVLLAYWGDVSDDLCADLMNYDAANHPEGDTAFAAWVEGGACPYSGCRVARSAHFVERKSCYRPERPLQSALQLMDRLIAEKAAAKS